MGRIKKKATIMQHNQQQISKQQYSSQQEYVQQQQQFSSQQRIEQSFTSTRQVTQQTQQSGWFEFKKGHRSILLDIKIKLSHFKCSAMCIKRSKKCKKRVHS